MPVYIVWDYWREENTFYAIVEESGTLYFSEAIIPDNLKEKEK